MEELLNLWDESSTSIKYDFLSLNGTPTLFSLDAAVASSSKKGRQELQSTSPTAIFEPTAKALREVSVLILTSLDVFPVLQQIDLDQLLVNQYIKDLMNYTPNLTLRFARVYPEKISLSVYRKMVRVCLFVSFHNSKFCNNTICIFFLLTYTVKYSNAKR